MFKNDPGSQSPESWVPHPLLPLTPTPLTDPLPSNPSSFINPGLLPMSRLLLQKDDNSGRGESKGDSLSNQEVTVDRRGGGLVACPPLSVPLPLAPRTLRSQLASWV